VSIGVVIPARNAAPFIADALASLLRQTRADWQAVVVDDGSTDDTAAVAARCTDPRIRLLRQPPAGVSAARNAGVAALAADRLLFLDADDWLAPDAIERLDAALAGSAQAVAVYGAYAFVGADGQKRAGCRATAAPGDLLPRLVVRNLFTNGGHLLVRAPAFNACGGFCTALSFGEDWDCWVRLALHGPFAPLADDRPVLYVRRPATGAFRTLGRTRAAMLPAIERIFADPGVIARLGPELPALHARALAELDWLIGREQMRHGHRADGRQQLRRAFQAAPTLRRALLLAGAHLAPDLLEPFRRYDG
jgi:glycosyltransferase involved in cell wall biosynthesis